jgi:hypothetical protein
MRNSMSTPKDILIKAINEYLLERIESLGFKFNESQLKIKRKRGDFSQEIWFRGSKNNMGFEIVDFEYQFVITHSKYKKLLKDLGEKIYSSSSIIQGNNEALKLWDRSKQIGFGYDFVKMSHKEIMDDIYKNLMTAGIPYFNANDSEEKIANDSSGNEKIDFLIYLGEYPKALEQCEYSFAEFDKLSDSDKTRFSFLMDTWNRKYEYIKRITGANNV